MMAQFRRGDFKEYRATNKIHLGQHKVDIMEDDIIEYDGITLKMGPDEFNTTLLRGAIKRGWLVPAEDTESVYVPQSAGVTIGPVNTGNPMDHKNKRRLAAAQRQMDVDSLSNEGGVVVAGQGFTDFSAPENRRRTHGTVGAGRRSMAVEAVDQEGTVVASVSKLPSREDSVVVTNSAMAQNAISKTLSTPRKARIATSGTPEPEIDTSGLSPEEAAVLKKLMAKASGTKTAAHPSPTSQRDPDYVPPEDAPWIKSEEEKAAAKAEAEAARAARLADMGVTDDPASRKNAAPPVEAPISDAEVLDDGTLVLDGEDVPEEEPDAEMDIDLILEGDAPPADEDMEKRILAEKMKMLQAMFPGFEWDMDLQWRKRVAIACKQHYGKPTLAAIKQIETEAVVKYIEQYEDKMAAEQG